MGGTAKFAWGITASGEIRHIGNVPNGLACKCTCLDCERPLIAHQGLKKAAHFQHASATTCTGESVLHKAAKQMLVDAAASGRALETAESEGELESQDIRGQTYRRSWQVPSTRELISSVSVETYLTDDLIADALVQSTQEYSLAVEIFVTNRKDERAETKYRAIGQDALEIDLSGVAWDIDPASLQRQVLKDAPRLWVYSNAIGEARRIANEALHTEVNQANRLFRETFDAAVAYLRDQQWLTSPKFPWPKLTGVAYIPQTRKADGSAWKKPVRVEHRPCFTQLYPDWERTEIAWSARGLVNGRSEAVIEFIPDLEGWTPRSWPCAALVVRINVEQLYRKQTAFELMYALKPDWIGIDKWHERLTRLAEEKRDSQIAKRKERQAWRLSFAQQPPRQQFEQVTTKWMEVECPSHPGKFAPAWNTTYHVWKSVIWHLAIKGLFTGKRDAVKVNSLVDSAFFFEMFGWPKTLEASEQRSKNLWFWFKSLGVL